MTKDARYLFDVTRLIWRRWVGRNPTGVDRVCLAYLRRFASRSQAVIQHKHYRGIIRFEASQQLFGLLAEPVRRFRRKLVLGTLRNVPSFGSRGDGRIYLNIGHTGLDSEGFRSWVRRSNVKPVYFIHDLIPLTHPMFCRAGEAQRHRARMRTVLETAAGVIANSRVTLRDLAEFARTESLPMPPTLAAWLGIDLSPRLPSGAAGSDRPTFIVLGTIEARKNHQLVLDVWRRLIDRLGNDAPRLLIIGQRGWEADKVFHQLDNDVRLRGHVTEISDCSDDELARHLASARALLFPSLAEGFGLPLIEALAAGLPAIASDLPVFREICGNVPEYLGSADVAGWEQAIIDYAAPDSARRNRQLVRLNGFAGPTWDAHFKRVEKWLDSLA
jgi:glycosyltransferase involved in cell wall biosynthesis